jgi:murein DD-endopeptidase MepM/ murein hydrolase activator NlpD
MKHFSKSIGQCLMTVLMTSTILELYALPLLAAFDSAASAAPAEADRATSKATAVVVPTTTPPEASAPENVLDPSAPVTVETTVEATHASPEPTETPVPAAPQAAVPQTAAENPPIAPEPIASPSPTPAETSEIPSPAAAPAAAPAADMGSTPESARLTAARQAIANKLAALVNRDRPALASQLQKNLVALALYYAQIGEFEDARQVAHHPALPPEIQTTVLAEIDQFVAQAQLGGQPQPGQVAQAGQIATDSKTPSDPSKPNETSPAAAPLTVATAVNPEATADPGYLTIPVAPELLQPYLSDRCLNPDVVQPTAAPAATSAKPIATAQPPRSSPFLPIGQHVAAQLKSFSVAASPSGKPAQPTSQAIAPPVQISQTVVVSKTAPVRYIPVSPAVKAASPIAKLEATQLKVVPAEVPSSSPIASPTASTPLSPAINPLGAVLPKTIGSTVSSWLYDATSSPLETSRNRLLSTIEAPSHATEAAPTDSSLLPEDSYTPTQIRIDMSALPKFIKLTREATKLTAFSLIPSVSPAIPIANSIAANQPPVAPTADYWRTIATNCGGLQSANAQQAYAMSPAMNRKLAGNGMIFPLPIAVPITSGFGWRIHPISGDRRFHTGLDLGAPFGTPVLSAMAGRVVQAGEMGGYGLAVIVEAASGQEQNLYGHLSAIAVRPGDQVAQGAVLGLVGSTGNSTGPHLHFETLLPTTGGWTAVDPLAAATLALASAPR